MRTAALLLGIWLLLFPAALTLAFLLTHAGSGHLDDLRRRFGGLARPLLASAASAVLAHLLILATYPLPPLARRILRPRPGQGPALVLVHGLYHNPSAWLVMGLRLRRAGFRDLRLVSYPSFGRTLPELAFDLQEHLRAILAESPDRTLLLLGHSLGGLLVRAALADPDIAARTPAAVALGSPHQGSRLARLGIGRLARSLADESPLPAAVAALPCPPDTRLLNIASPTDDMVLPNHACAPSSCAWTLATTPPVSHVALLHHPHPARLIAEYFRKVE